MFVCLPGRPGNGGGGAEVREHPAGQRKPLHDQQLGSEMEVHHGASLHLRGEGDRVAQGRFLGRNFDERIFGGGPKIDVEGEGGSFGNDPGEAGSNRGPVLGVGGQPIELAEEEPGVLRDAIDTAAPDADRAPRAAGGARRAPASGSGGAPPRTRARALRAASASSRRCPSGSRRSSNCSAPIR